MSKPIIVPCGQCWSWFDAEVEDGETTVACPHCDAEIDVTEELQNE
jgi:hypothetical protein